MTGSKAVLYLPRFPENPRRRAVDKLLEIAGGLTIVDGFGLWRDSNGITISDKVDVVTVYFKAGSLGGFALDWVDEIAERYMREAMQECVLYEFDGQPHFITKE